MIRKTLVSLKYRTIFLLLAALIFAGASAAPRDRSLAATPGTTAPAAVTVRVVGPAGPVPVGATFAVTVQVEAADNLGAFEFDFGSTASVASTTAADIHLGSFLGSTGRSTGELRLAASPIAPGRPLYAAYSYGLPQGPSGSGQLATIRMLAAGVGTSSLDLGNLKVTDIAGVEVVATSVSGSVVVRSGTRPVYLPLIRNNFP